VTAYDPTPAALALAAHGWAVFPCKWRGENAKAPLTINGHHDASRDHDQITAWWTRWPNAMIGAPVPESMLVIDIDPRNRGSLDALEQIAGPMPITLAVWSGRNDGGRHLYFQRPLGQLTSTRLPDGVDLKVGGKSYCVVPPSIHPDTGKPYRWVSRCEPAILPARLQGLLTPPPRPIYRPRNRNTSAVGLLRKVAEASEGNRNNALFWAACRAGEDGILDEIEDQLLAAAISTGVSELGARKTVTSARRTTT
jgi:Bifunctional DNA primase/polymerase, N-terminal